MNPSLAYIPLHVRSCYSINDGLQNVGPIVKKAAKMGFPAIAVTDFNNMAGFVRFYNECLKAGIKPIMGADLQVFEEEVPGQAREKFLITALAMDWTGKNNLYELLSNAWLNVGSPDIEDAACTLEDLAKYSAGLILLDGFRGDFGRIFRENNTVKEEQRIAFYKKYFADRFCFEITRTGRNGESEFESRALDLCLKHNIAPVATNDTRFLNGNSKASDGLTDYYVHDVRVSIQRGIPRGSKELSQIYSEQQYLISAEEMEELFADLPEALENSRAVAMRCNIKDKRVFELDKPRLPHYDTGDMSAADKLRELSRNGLKKRLEFLYPDKEEREKVRAEYEERLETELNVIIQMDFPGYFLIVQDFINWSKDHGVPVGPGRGSGGGSLVAYATGITDFDPLRFQLLFERFLNPERVSMPDFDVDFCQRTRVKTLTYVKEHYDEISLKDYGEISVSQIAAFGTLAAKAALKGAGKALGMPYGQVDSVAKLIPDAPGTTFDSALGIKEDGSQGEPESPDFANLYNHAKLTDDREIVNLINVSRRLEGVIRSIGKHAAGVVISPTKLTEFSPLMLDADGKPITQYDKKDVEHAGLVKFDFLGLTTLTIIEDAMVMIRRRLKREGKRLFEVAEIPYEDDACFKMLQEGETTAVFQLESTGMRKLIGQMQPDRFEDLVALVALYRPGPIQSRMVQHFVDRKRGTEKVSYPQPDFEELDLKPVLESTYGVIVYQEQVMQIAQVLAGYSLGGADILRRAMGKKKPLEMAAQREVFREGAIKKGRDPDVDMKIFDQVEKFAKYGFNKSHSAAYALVAWWTLWLKVHYPAEFLAAMMTADAMNTDKLISYIAECRRLGITVNPPDVNVGEFHFGVDDKGAVIYGFSAIKGIGEALVELIKTEREQNGPFKDFFDFTSRVYISPDGRKLLGRTTLQRLVQSGALDSLHANRAAMMASVDTALKYADQKYSNRLSGQFDLFSALDEVRPTLCDCKDWGEKQRLFYEKQLLGLYLSGHPIDAYRKELDHYLGGTTLKNMVPGTPDRPNFVRVSGVVIGYALRYSKKDNSKYYFVTLDDSTTTFELPLYSRNAEIFAAIIEKHNRTFEQKKASAPKGVDVFPSPLVLVIDGRLTISDDGMPKLGVRGIHSLEELRQRDARGLIIRMHRKNFDAQIGKINRTLNRNRIRAKEVAQRLSQCKSKEESENIVQGCDLSLLLDNVELSFEKRVFRYLPTEDLLDTIREVGGNDAVIITY